MKTSRCPWNKALECDGKGCPLESEGFYELIHRWALGDRTPRALDLSVDPVDGGRCDIVERIMLAKAEIARFFDDDRMVLDWIESEGKMEAAVCAELKNGMEKMNDLSNAQFAESNELFRKACAGVGTDPTTRQASKWRMHKGKAYGYYRRYMQKK